MWRCHRQRLIIALDMALGVGFLNPKKKKNCPCHLKTCHIYGGGLLIHEKILEIINWDICSLIIEIVHFDKHEIQLPHSYKHTELGSLRSVAQESIINLVSLTEIQSMTFRST